MTLQAMEPRLVLASQSTARAGLLRAAGLVFETRPAHVDEDAVKQAARAEGASVVECATMLAELKALRVSRNGPEAMVIGAAQILDCEGRWFDKPADMAAAADHLRALRGRAHDLVTVVVCARGGQAIWRHVVRPRLVMRSFSEGFLATYLTAEGQALLSSVGAYRIEAMGMHLFDQIEGEHSAILGLPMPVLLGFLRQQGILVT